MSNIFKAASTIIKMIFSTNENTSIWGQFLGFVRSINFNKREHKSTLLATIDLLSSNDNAKKQKLFDSLETFYKRKRSKIYLAQQLNRIAKKIYSKDSSITQRDIVIIDAYFERTAGISLLQNPTEKHIKRIASQKQREALLLAQRLASGNITSEDVDNILEVKLMYELEGRRRRARYRERKVKNLEDNSYSISRFMFGKEFIKFYNSSWLDYAIYDPFEKTADIKLLRSAKIYTFYWVPRASIYLLQKLNGKFMWDGFGFRHSTNPTRWIRKELRK